MRASIALLVIILTACSTVAQADKLEPQGGLVVCIGNDAIESVSPFWDKPGCVYHCLVTTDAEVSELRKTFREAGIHGKVSVLRFDGKTLPYINNLVNQIVVDDRYDIAPEELRRVLAPYGVVLAKGKKITKPFPANMDEWPQYLHGADNNAVSGDTVVGPPRHIQWISGPAWTRSHMGAATIASQVSAGGRLFTIEDRETAENPFLPAKWKLIARDAFNGIVLWTLDYPTWEPITVYIKTFHAQPQRRLAAIGDVLYCTPGLDAPVTALDAATGEKIREFAGTSGTQEFAYHKGTLYVVLGDRMQEGRTQKKSAPKKPVKATQGAQPAATGQAFGNNGYPLKHYNPHWSMVAEPTNVIVAFDAESGKELWRSDPIRRYTGCSMALKGDKLVYQATAGLRCLDAVSGKPIWSVEKTIPYGRGAMPHTLVVTDDAVYSEEGANVFAYSLEDGSSLWLKPIKARKGYQASSDVLIAADALWMCGNNGTPTSYDLKTGELIKTIKQQFSEPMGHDRCFRNFITERYFINSKTGGPDCLDLLSDTEFPAPFTRATCSMGPLPCNGLIYAGPYACQCHLPVGLHNFNVYYTNEEALQTVGQKVNVERKVRLEEGPAFGTAITGIPKRTKSDDWPTYRQGLRRYAATKDQIPATGLAPIWKTKLAGRVTAPTIAGGKVFVAQTDAHVLHSIDAATGEKLWDFVADGRIDSPPTYYQGLLLFGCRSGWVYCLRASDGAMCWRFKDLPELMLCAFGQLESPWPVHGSVLVKNRTAYFCAGRSSYLDGGLFLYGLDLFTGKILHSRQFYGPYAPDGFPAYSEVKTNTREAAGTTADVMTCEGDTLYIRHQAFNLDLTDAKAETHLLASAGLLEANRMHREYTLVKDSFNNRKTWTSRTTVYPVGDIIVADGTDYFSVFGMPVNRHSSFNPEEELYALSAKRRTENGWTKRWETTIPLTGKAMVLASDIVFVVGAPVEFDSKDLAGTYHGRRGAILWAAAAEDGVKLAQYKLDVLPAWDGMAAADGRLYIVGQDGSVVCWGVKP